MEILQVWQQKVHFDIRELTKKNWCRESVPHTLWQGSSAHTVTKETTSFGLPTAETLLFLFNFLLVVCAHVIFPGVCNYWIQWLPSWQFSFTQSFVQHWVFHEFSYLRANKYNCLEFFHAYPWEIFLEESKPAALPIHSIHKVLHYFKFDI